MKDLTVGKPSTVLWKYILPLFGSVVFQQLYNIADSVIAGKFIGQNALAAVGNSYEITLVYLAFAFGCNIGASVIIAKLLGENKLSDMKTAISTSFIVTVITCIVLMIVGFAAGEALLSVMNTPSDIFADSAAYLKIYTGGLMFSFVYNITTGIFAALGDSITPFIFLVISSLGNIGMDVLFVAALNLGVEGIAWATFICQGISGIFAFILLIRQIKKIKTDDKPKFFSLNILKKFAIVAIPSVLQQSIVSVGNITLQGLINGFGTATIAGYSAAIKFNNFAVVSFVQIGNGISNFTAQNLGANKVDRIKKSIKTGIGIVVLISAVFITLYQTAGQYIMLLFLKTTDVEAITVGVRFLRIVSPFYFIASLKLISDGVLRGASKMMLFMIGTLADLVIRVALSFILTPKLGSDGIWWSWPFGWIIGMIISWIFYFSKTWIKQANSDKNTPPPQKTQEA